VVFVVFALYSRVVIKLLFLAVAIKLSVKKIKLLKVMKNPTFSFGPGVLEMLDIIPETHLIFRVDARFSSKANSKPIFLVLANLLTILCASKSNLVDWT
jgi:hypothetical protein